MAIAYEPGDSSAWLAYFANESSADFFAKAIEDEDQLVVPSVCVYEVFKVVLRERGEDLGAVRGEEGGSTSCRAFRPVRQT